MNLINTTTIKLILATLLFICLLDMPYGYFQLVRFLAMIFFSYLSYTACQEDRRNIAYIFASLAILFQPLIKIALGREIWNVVDVLVGCWLLYLVYLDVFKRKNWIFLSKLKHFHFLIQKFERLRIAMDCSVVCRSNCFSKILWSIFTPPHP